MTGAAVDDDDNDDDKDWIRLEQPIEQTIIYAVLLVHCVVSVNTS